MFTKSKIWSMISIFFQHFYKLCFDVLRSFPTNWASNLTHDSGTFRAAPCLVCYQYGSFVCSVIANALSPCSRDLSLAYPTQYHVPGLKLEVRHLSTFQTFILLFFCRNLWGTCVESSDALTKTSEPRFYDLWRVRRPESTFHLGTNKPTTINNKLLQLEILQCKIIKTCLSLLFLFALFKNPLIFFPPLF